MQTKKNLLQCFPHYEQMRTSFPDVHLTGVPSLLVIVESVNFQAVDIKKMKVYVRTTENYKVG